MAFVTRRGGDRLNIQFTPSTLPKAYGGSYIAAWNTTNTVPLVGDMVKIDTTANDQVLQCVANDVAYGMVWSVNSSNGTLTVVKFAAVRAVIFEYAGSPTRGQSVQANGSLGVIPIGGMLRNQMKGVGFAAGTGIIVAVDEPRTGLMVVEYPGLTATGG